MARRVLHPPRGGRKEGRKEGSLRASPWSKAAQHAAARQGPASPPLHAVTVRGGMGAGCALGSPPSRAALIGGCALHQGGGLTAAALAPARSGCSLHQGGGALPSYAALKESFRPGVFFTTRFQLSFPPSPRRYGRSTPAHPQRPCGPSLRAARGVFPSSCQSFCRSVCGLAGRRASLRRFGGAPPIEPHISRKIARIGTRSRRKA